MKYIKITLIIIMIFAFLLGIIKFVIPNVGFNEEVLNENIAEFSYVANYLLEHKSEYIYWYEHEPEYISCNYDDYEIDDEIIMLNSNVNLKNNIQKLKEVGVDAIIKIDDYIEFATSYSLDDSNGYIYRLNDKPQPEYFGETKIFETSISNWYFYKHFSD